MQSPRYKVDIRVGCVVLIDTFTSKEIKRFKGRVVNRQWKVKQTDINYLEKEAKKLNQQYQINFKDEKLAKSISVNRGCDNYRSRYSNNRYYIGW